MIKTPFIEAGCTVVVTGAARGIGASVARRLAADGCAVVCCDLKRDDLEVLVEELVASGGTAVGVVGDVSNEEDAASFAAAAVSLGRPVKGLVNNAGIAAFGLKWESLELEEWNRIIGINLTSIFLVTRAVLPQLKETGGVVVNVASVHSFATSTGVAPYAASKGGVIALTRAMALDLADHGIRVVAVAPGAVHTDILDQRLSSMKTTLEERRFPQGEAAIGRLSQPDEVAAAIRFLLSSESTVVNGSVLPLESGLLATFARIADAAPASGASSR
jgi:NAD(P)-dependent dehydrogenase (short-subunit alcohol dehydrogenase family)